MGIHDPEISESEPVGQVRSLSRRDFLKHTSLAGGGLMLGLHVGASALAQSAGAALPFAPNAFIRLGADNSVLIYSKAPEIGQGIKTVFAMIVAEEMDADWSRVTVEQAPVRPEIYGRQSAGGSHSITGSWTQLRRAGAMARAMLIEAAAQTWNVPVMECSVAKSVVTHGKSGRSLSYGALAAKAAALKAPDEKTLQLKAVKDWRLLGSRIGGVDNAKVVTGAPLFGSDARLPGMVYAVYVKSPASGGAFKTASLDAVRASKGVRDVFVLEGNGNPQEVKPGIAIIASSTWAAFEARQKLNAEWDAASGSTYDSAVDGALARATLKETPKQVVHNHGDVDAAFARAAKTVEMDYEYPFVAHATLEPQNCTAWFHDGIMEYWVSTQAPDRILPALAKLAGVTPDKVVIHQMRVGGGFGRRLINDFMCEATLIAKRVNAPVKLQWSREDDFSHDHLRVVGYHAFKGALDEKGALIGWSDHFVTHTADGKAPVSGGDFPDEIFPLPVIANGRISQTMFPIKTPCGPWRAPGDNALAFALNGFLYEMAVAAKRDHVEFLLEILGEPRWIEPKNENTLNTGRAAAVIRLAAEKSGWGKKLPKGHGLGISFFFSHSGHVAEVAEVSLDANKKLTVHRVTVVADVGPVLNPSGAEAQCEGAVIDGLSTILAQEITIAKGRVTQTNFDSYKLMRMAKAPLIDVHFIESDFPPTGLGEPALPPLASAVCNAIHAAGGNFIRRLPLIGQKAVSV